LSAGLAVLFLIFINNQHQIQPRQSLIYKVFTQIQDGLPHKTTPIHSLQL